MAEVALVHYGTAYGIGISKEHSAAIRQKAYGYGISQQTLGLSRLYGASITYESDFGIDPAVADASGVSILEISETRIEVVFPNNPRVISTSHKAGSIDRDRRLTKVLRPYIQGTNDTIHIAAWASAITKGLDSALAISNLGKVVSLGTFHAETTPTFSILVSDYKLVAVPEQVDATTPVVSSWRLTRNTENSNSDRRVHPLDILSGGTSARYYIPGVAGFDGDAGEGGLNSLSAYIASRTRKLSATGTATENVNVVVFPTHDPS